MARLDRRLLGIATTLVLLGAAPGAYAECDPAAADPAGKLVTDVASATGAQKLQQIKDAMTELATASGWVRPGYVLHISVPAVNEFAGSGLLELFGSVRPTTLFGKLKSHFVPNRFSRFRVFVAVNEDGSLKPDEYDRAQAERFESTGRYFRFLHSTANAWDVVKDVSKQKDALKGLVMSGLAIALQIPGVATGTVPFTAFIGGAVGWKGFETIGQSVGRLNKARDGVLQASIKDAEKKLKDEKHFPDYNYGDAYEEYQRAMHDAGLSAVMSPSDFFRALREAGVLLQ